MNDPLLSPKQHRGVAMRPALAYLDHSVLDWIVKGKIDSAFLRRAKVKVTAVYSVETLREIRRSKGSEQQFLDALKSLQASFLQPDMLGNRVGTTATISNLDPYEQYQHHVDADIEMHGAEEALLQVMQSLFGSEKVPAIQDSMEKLGKSAEALIQQVREFLKGPNLGITEAQSLLLHGTTDELLAKLNGNAMSSVWNGSSHTVEQLHNTLAGGPKTLKNIKGPNVVQQIWKRLPNEITHQMSAEQFFGVVAGPFQQQEPISEAEKANAVYHMLNFIGFHRDKKLWKQEKMVSLFSDLSHTGYASFCDILISRDKAQLAKAAAAYEFVGCKTVAAKIEIAGPHGKDT